GPRQMLGQLRAVAFDLSALVVPGRARPDLDAVADADHDHLALELRVVAQELRDDHAAELVELSGRGAREEQTLHAAGVTLPQIEGAHAFGDGAPAVGVPDDQAGLEAAGDDQAIVEGGSVASRDRESTLVVEGMFVDAEEGWWCGHRGLPLSTTSCHRCSTVRHPGWPGIGAPAHRASFKGVTSSRRLARAAAAEFSLDELLWRAAVAPAVLLGEQRCLASLLREPRRRARLLGGPRCWRVS